MNEDKITTLSSIVLLLLKELRLEINVHQAHIADICDKTPSSWNKIESGKSPLTMEVFFKVCQAFQVSSSYVLATAERYAGLFGREGWAIISKQLSFDDDALLKDAQKYYSTLGYKTRIPRISFNINVSVLNGPFYNQDGTVDISEVFKFALDENFKQTQINFQVGLNK
ncbi:MAG: helix-turn-helix transcriptional regulator [Sulfurospirillum sp.]|nr:helix-turn-helix transcriptional regulator [Sulfurospirillum sp.]